MKDQLLNEEGFLRERYSDSHFITSCKARRKQLTPDVYVTWKAGETVSDSDVPIYEIAADIWHQCSPNRVGYYRGYVVCPIWEGLDKPSFWRMCDDHSQTLLGFAEEILKTPSSLSRFTGGGEILFPHLMELLPAYRRQGIGASVFRFLLEKAVHRFGVSICVFNPDPLQFHMSMDDKREPETMRAYKAALKSLRRYYVETFGAKGLRPGSSYYYIRLNEG